VHLIFFGKVSSVPADVASELGDNSNVEAKGFQVVNREGPEHLVSVDVVVEEGAQHPLTFLWRNLDKFQVVRQVTDREIDFRRWWGGTAIRGPVLDKPLG